MAFTVGQKVVCVETSEGRVGHRVIKDQVYTVRDVLISPIYRWPALRVEELVNPFYAPINGEGFYFAKRFRPIVERKTEISFTTGADPESEKWDNRKAVPAYSFDVTEHESILQYLRGFY